MSPRDWLSSERARDHLFDVIERLPLDGDDVYNDDDDDDDDDDAGGGMGALNRSWDGGARGARPYAKTGATPLSRSFNTAALRSLRTGAVGPAGPVGAGVSASSLGSTSSSVSSLSLSHSGSSGLPTYTARAARQQQQRLRQQQQQSSYVGGSSDNGHRDDSERPERYTQDPSDDYVHVPNPNRVLRKHEREASQRTPITDRLNLPTTSARAQRVKRVAAHYTSQL